MCLVSRSHGGQPPPVAADEKRNTGPEVWRPLCPGRGPRGGWPGGVGRWAAAATVVPRRQPARQGFSAALAVAAVALSARRFRLRLALAVLGQRPAHVLLLREAPGLVAPGVPLVAGVRLDQLALA